MTQSLRQPLKRRFENPEGAPAVECVGWLPNPSLFKRKGWTALTPEQVQARVAGKTFGTFTVLDTTPKIRRRVTRKGFDYLVECQCQCGVRRWYRLDTIFRSNGDPAPTQPNMCRQCYRVLIRRKR